MNKFTYILLISIISILACSGNDNVVITDRDVIHPILNMEVVKVPSEGTVIELSDDADIKKKGKNEYSKIMLETIVSEDDIIWLKKGSEVKISFEDGSYILNEPPAKDLFITFDLINSDNMPK